LTSPSRVLGSWGTAQLVDSGTSDRTDHDPASADALSTSPAWDIGGPAVVQVWPHGEPVDVPVEPDDPLDDGDDVEVEEVDDEEDSPSVDFRVDDSDVVPVHATSPIPSMRPPRLHRSTSAHVSVPSRGRYVDSEPATWPGPQVTGVDFV
jgi:hypothetical protein